MRISDSTERDRLGTVQRNTLARVVFRSQRAEERDMAREIAIAGIEGSLEVNDDGELVYTKSELQTEVLKPEQAIQRWPTAEKQIRKALEKLE
jgi:uncharacterized protein (DUF849 family)